MRIQNCPSCVSGLPLFAVLFFIFCLYRPQDDGVIIFDRISDKIDSILLDHPHVCGDFNVHHEEWLVHSNKTDMEGIAIVYGLTQIVTEPTLVPDVASHFPNLLDLFLTTVLMCILCSFASW